MASWSSSKPPRSSSSSWPRAASEMSAAEGGGGGGGAGVSGLCSHAEALAGATAMCDCLLRRCVRTGAVGGAENCTRVGRSAVGSGSTGASAATARMRWNCSWRPRSRVSWRSRPRAHLSAGYSAEAISSRVKVGCAALLSAEAGAALDGPPLWAAAVAAAAGEGLSLRPRVTAPVLVGGGRWWGSWLASVPISVVSGKTPAHEVEGVVVAAVLLPPLPRPPLPPPLPPPPRAPPLPLLPRLPLSPLPPDDAAVLSTSGST